MMLAWMVERLRQRTAANGAQASAKMRNNTPIVSTDLFPVDITAKSWIAEPITRGTVPGGNDWALWYATELVSLLTDDRVVDDSIDGAYRFLSRKVISVECDGSTVKSVHFSQIFTDVGFEGGFMIPPDAIVVHDRSSSSSSDVDFSWMIKARPKPLAEPFVFTPVRDRHGHVYIWHLVSGSIQCKCGTPVVSLNLLSSRFPSAAVYFRIDGSGPTLGAFFPQGAMARLWDPHPGDPKLVR